MFLKMVFLKILQYSLKRLQTCNCIKKRLQHLPVHIVKFVKGRIHCEIFLSEHFMKYFYFSIQYSLCMFLINKKLRLQREKIWCKI